MSENSDHAASKPKDTDVKSAAEEKVHDGKASSADAAAPCSACAGLMAWVEDRTGVGGLIHEMLYERIPGGSRWRYVWGSTLIFAFVVQAITGTVLWMHYSPSDTTAWESVQYIQHHMQGGWLLRGLHHFMAQAMVVLLAIHLLQVVIDGAYKAPREVNFWLGLILMQIVLALSLTGYLLPWDQKGYWATGVATNIMGMAPPVGEQLQQLVVGGDDYNHHTVTRFFALHAGVLPALLVMFVAAHVAVFRRHGVTPKLPLKGADQYFWPDQVLKDSVACLAVMAAVLGLTIYFHGAELTAPADGAREYSAARPEWYFLFLFQFLKFFKGHIGEIIGAIIIPGVVVGAMFLMPFVARLKNGHAYNVAFIALLLIGAAALTGMALYEDANKLDIHNAKWVAHEEARLANHIATHEGISKSGMADQLRRDPRGQALGIITKECFACHSYQSPDGEGFISEQPTASNLHGFGTAAWARGFLEGDGIATSHYFGNTHEDLKIGEMARWLKTNPLSEDAITELSEALAAEAHTTAAALPDLKRQATFDQHGCLACHSHGGAGVGNAPSLDGWGSTRWIAAIVSNPNSIDRAHTAAEGETLDKIANRYGVPPQSIRRYNGAFSRAVHPGQVLRIPHLYGHLGKSQAMPAFGHVPGHVPGSAQPKNLPPEVIWEIARWFRGAWYENDEAAPTSTDRATAVRVDEAPDHPRDVAAFVVTNQCFKCHLYERDTKYATHHPTAPNLHGFGGADWAKGILDVEKIVSAHYFGNTKLKTGDMVGFLKDNELEADAVKSLADALAAEATTKADDEPSEARLEVFGNNGCLECHTYAGEGGGAPTFTGWGSARWLSGMVANPGDEMYYGHLDAADQKMPAYGTVEDNPHAKGYSDAVLREIGQWFVAARTPGKK